MNSRNSILFILVLVLGILVSGCSPKQQSRWTGENFSYELGEIPDDICLVDGNPLILNATTESDGDFSLVYVRNNGDVVIRHWATKPIADWVLFEAGEFYWRGGDCPSRP